MCAWRQRELRGDLELAHPLPFCTHSGFPNVRLGCEEVLTTNSPFKKGTGFGEEAGWGGRRGCSLPLCGRGSLNPVC